MKGFMNYLVISSMIFAAYVSSCGFLYITDAAAQEQVAQVPVSAAQVPSPAVQVPTPANTSAASVPSPDPSAAANAPAVEEKAPEKPVEPPKPSLSPAEQKKLRDDIIYRTNLGRSSDVKILLEKGALVNETNDSGTPLISLAASRSDMQAVAVVKVLLEAGAEINKVDPRGRNALFYAAKSGNKEVVELLLSKKIHYSAVDNAGNNARVIAYQVGNNSIVEILDNFVRGQNEVVRRQYDEANQEIAKRNKEYNDKIQEQMRKRADEQNKIRLASSQTGAIQDAVHNLAYSSCSASYWQYCSSVSQQTQFSAKEIVSNINAQNTHVNELLNILVKEFYIRNDIAQNIITVSADTIRTQLSEYPSNEQRKEEGVGTSEDMNRRCNLIADTWQATPKKGR